MVDTTAQPAAAETAPVAAPAPEPTVKPDSLEDLVQRVARIESHLNINPDAE